MLVIIPGHGHYHFAAFYHLNFYLTSTYFKLYIILTLTCICMVTIKSKRSQFRINSPLTIDLTIFFVNNCNASFTIFLSNTSYWFVQTMCSSRVFSLKLMGVYEIFFRSIPDKLFNMNHMVQHKHIGRVTTVLNSNTYYTDNDS